MDDATNVKNFVIKNYANLMHLAVEKVLQETVKEGLLSLLMVEKDDLDCFCGC